MSDIDYSNPNNTPPIGQAIPLGLQHVLAMFASNVTPSIIVAGAAGLAFGGAEQIYLIQMAMLFAGIATLFQTVGAGPIGSRLPIMQGTSFAFVGVLAGVAAYSGSQRSSYSLYNSWINSFCFRKHNTKSSLHVSSFGYWSSYFSNRIIFNSSSN